MIDDARRGIALPDIAIDRTIEDAVRGGCVVALNVSGGKDSLLATHMAMLELDRLGHDRRDRIAIHADLGAAEWRSTGATVEAQAAALGLRLVTASRAAGDMVDRWEQRYEQGMEPYAALHLARLRGPWSSSGSRFCTSELKRDVLHRHLAAEYPGRTIISVLGIRRAESAKRRLTPISRIDGRLKRASGTNGILWHPLVDVSTDEVYAALDRTGLPMHEAYGTYGSTRLSCAFCVLASAHDLAASASARQNAPLLRRLVAIEARTGFSFQQKKWLADVAPDLLDADLRGRVAAAKAYAAERRAIEAGITKDFLLDTKEARWPRRPPTGDEAMAIASARRINGSWMERSLPYLTTAAVTDRIGQLIARRAEAA